MIHITDNILVLVCFIDVAIKRPHRPVTEGAYDEPEHEKALEHVPSLSGIAWIVEVVELR